VDQELLNCFLDIEIYSFIVFYHYHRTHYLTQGSCFICSNFSIWTS